MQIILKFILVSLLLIFYASSKAQNNNLLNFNSIGSQDGFVGEIFFCSAQDSLGFMWFGSENGLFVFDGVRMKSYRHNNDDQNSLKSHRVSAIYHHNAYTSFIATSKGLNLMNRKNDTFETLPQGASDMVFFIIPQGDHLWYGTNKGVYRLNLITMNVDFYSSKYPKGTKNHFYGTYVACGSLSIDKQFITGTYNYISFFDQKTETFDHFKLPFNHLFENNLLLSVRQDISDHNKYWLGTEQALFLWDKTTQEAQIIMRGNPIKTLYFQNNKTLWVGTDNGLFYKKNGTTNFVCLSHDAENPSSLPSNIIWHIFIDREDNLWLSTQNGVSMAWFNQLPQPDKIKHITGSNQGNQIFTINSHKDDILMGGTQGLIFYNRKSGKSALLNSEAPQGHRLTHNRIRDIHLDKSGIYWIASDKGLNSYDPVSGRVRHHNIISENSNCSSSWLYHIAERDNKLFLSACQGGVFVVDKSQLLSSDTAISPLNHYNTYSHAQTLPSNDIGSTAFTDPSSLWVASTADGLCKISLTDNTQIEYFNTQNGRLASNFIKNIIALSDGRLVVVSSEYIEIIKEGSKNKVIFQSEKKDIISAIKVSESNIIINSMNGLTLIDLDRNSSSNISLEVLSSGSIHSIFYDSISGLVYWGGVDVYGSVRLSDFQPQIHLPSTHITSLSISGKIIRPNELYSGHLVLPDQISLLDGIELLSNQNSFTLEFSSLLYSPRQSFSYKYRMVGLSNEWHTNVRGENYAAFLNLPPGTYKFEVATLQANGTMSGQIRSFKVSILQPWYLSTIAWIVYSILALLFFLLIVLLIRSRQKLFIERIEKERSLKFSQMKINFMTNMAHELKTPLSLILGKISLMIGREANTEKEQNLISIHRNAQQIEKLVLQTIQSNHLNNGLMIDLSLEVADISPYIVDILGKFTEQMSAKQLTISNNLENQQLYARIDLMQFCSVIENLISNAIKFSYPGGSIVVDGSKDDDFVEFSVSDRGCGISQEDIPHIFERFFQSSNNQKGAYSGSGLGLAIARDIVLAHNGQLSVISQICQGSCFTVRLPRAIVTEDRLDQKHRVPEKDKKYEILLIEDNLEMLEFLALGLSDDFICHKSDNAKDGFKIALNLRPSLIITDLIMPDMRGDELTSKIRQNIFLASTPIIILTAANDQSNEIQSYTCGVDCFIGKPFDLNNLILRVWQLIRKAAIQQQKIRQEVLSTPTHERVISLQDKFIEQITKHIESQIEDPNLSVDILAENCKLTNKQLYRQIKQLTGMTPTEYIRQIRLKRAALLLAQGGFSVSEVLYMIGFSSPSYFSKCFKKAYGISPSEYILSSKSEDFQHTQNWPNG